MNKVFFIVLMLFLFIPKTLAISAESYVVIDASNNRVLEGKNIDKEKLIASTTKIMSCIIALENGELNSKIKVGKEVLKAYGSAIYIELGEEITLEDLLYGMMLRSGNDASILVAHLTCGSMEEFVKKMNEKAYELGMNNTNFVNNHGLEENDLKANTSTSYDMAILMSYAIKNETFRKIISTKNYQAKTSLKTYIWQNKNKLLFSYDKLIGGKTGYTKLAKRTLVTAAKDEEKTTVVVTLNDGNDFLDHKELHEKIFKNYDLVEVVEKYPLIDEANPTLYYLEKPIKILLTQNEQEKIKIDYELMNESDEGIANVYLEDKLIASEKIYKNKKEKESEKKSFFGRFFNWLFKW